MSFVYTPDPANNPGSFTLPSDGDPKAAASVVVPFQGIADLAARCRLYLTGGLSGPSFLNAIFNGTTTANGPIQGSGGLLLLSQPGETTIILGGSIHAAGFTHRFDGPVSFVGDPTVNSGVTCHVNGHLIVGVGADEIVSGTLAITGTENIASGGFLNVQSGGGFVIQSGGVGAIASGGTLQNNPGGLFANNGVIRNSSGGHISDRFLNGVDADHTYSIADADHISARPTVNRQYNFSNAGCTGGEKISVFNENASSHTLFVRQQDGSVIVDLNSSTYLGVELINDGSGNASSAWHIKNATRA